MNLIVLKCAACEHVSCVYDVNNVFKVKYYVSLLYFSYFTYISEKQLFSSLKVLVKVSLVLTMINKMNTDQDSIQIK